MRVKINKFGGVEVFTDTKDVCFVCGNKIDCPLVEALRAEIVILHYEEIDIQRCGLFKRSINNVKN
ncbi:MAG: hypothetical protein PHC34_02810 [Candidatus Gastranaerophilales bacterium]|nr:hypothetical protein [Candidatus Gastranaerophilales bacterium]